MVIINGARDMPVFASRRNFNIVHVGISTYIYFGFASTDEFNEGIELVTMSKVLRSLVPVMLCSRLAIGR